MNASRSSSVRFLAWGIAWALTMVAAWQPGLAATTQISDVPLANVGGAQVKPNVMLLMDTSASMGWGHMPDEVAYPDGNEILQRGHGYIGYKSAQCNVLYYNPQTTYLLPKKFDKSSFPVPSFSSAPHDVYDSTSTRKVNLSTEFQAYDDSTVRFPYLSSSNDTPQAAYYYVYTKNGATPDKLNYAAAPCTDLDKGATVVSAGGTWTRVKVSAEPDADQRNFAIWYTYYRTRMSLMKSATSLAFSTLSDNMRVGFITMNPKDRPDAAAINPSKFLPLADFDATQRQHWFNKLFEQKAAGSSPAREGLARVGRHYAGKDGEINTGMSVQPDPVQFSCQQNFTIMTTDGYWNDQAESPNGGPVGLDGRTPVGQQDGDLSDVYSQRPIYDGSFGSTRVVTSESTRPEAVPCTAPSLLESTFQLRARTWQVERVLTQHQETVTWTGASRKTSVQYVKTENQWFVYEYRNYRSTKQELQTRRRGSLRTFQYLWTNADEEGGRPVPNCDTSNPQCRILSGTETAQAPGSCTPGTTVGPAPQYIVTQCVDEVLDKDLPVPLGSCTAGVANGIQTMCDTVLTGPELVAACTPGTQGAGGGHVVTMCERKDSAPVTVQSCAWRTPSDANMVGLDCYSKPHGTPTVVASCTPGHTYVGNGVYETCTPHQSSFIVSSCVPQTGDAGNGWVTITCDADPSSTQIVPSCTPQEGDASNGWVTRTCSQTEAAREFVASCSSSGGWFWYRQPGTGLWYLVVTTCNDVNATAESLVASCTLGTTIGSAPALVHTACQRTNLSVDVPVAACSSRSGAAPEFIGTACRTGTRPGLKYVAITTRTETRTPYSGSVAAGPSTTVGPKEVDRREVDGGICHMATSLPPIAVTQSTPPAPCTSWPCTTYESNSNAHGSSNSLADVAQYYYKTPLRQGGQWPTTGPDAVKPKGDPPEGDFATHLHMTTFALALGASGTLEFKSDYKAATTGAFAGIRTGTKNWPVWPDPALSYASEVDKENWNSPKSIDDFWHAAVNGRGQFFSAEDPDDVVVSVDAALNKIQEEATGAPAAVSSLEPVLGNNFAYTASYASGAWTGDLHKRTIDLETGAFDATPLWSAQTLLDAKTGLACDSRSIFLLWPGAIDNKVDFSWNTRACDAAGQPTGSARSGLTSLPSSETAAITAHFDASEVGLLSQSFAMTAAQKTAAAGENLVNFLRGQRGMEGFQAGNSTRLYRRRSSALGDTVNAKPIYVQAPPSRYRDAGYQAFKAANSARKAMVYVAANDGMLHAFDADNGQEVWALVPSAVLPNLYKLADESYRNVHQYFVDGTPTVGDIYDNGAWKTILVGGFNKGARGYYAIDVTDPDAPKGLWELKSGSTCFDPGSATAAHADCDLGFSFGRPVIAKVKGKWVVMVTSGYNNVSPGNGRGHLYVLDAADGRIIAKISTPEGDTTAPSGLAQISAFADEPAVDNTALRVYGGDLRGNIWRFDVADRIGPSGREAALLGIAKDPNGSPQPITTAPELTMNKGKPMVFIATGRLLGVPDLSDRQVQSIYGFIDPMTAPSAGSAIYSNLRSALKPRVMTEIASSDGVLPAIRTISCPGTEAQCQAEGGWVVDLPDAGERVNIDMTLQAGTLVAGSNVPQESACAAGGHSWLNQLDFRSGLAITTSSQARVSQYLSNATLVGINVMTLPDTNASPKRPKVSADLTKGQETRDRASSSSPPAGKRISWREITL